MDKDFISEVGVLAKHLFGKEHLVAKKLNGHQLTGEGLIDLAIEYERVFLSGEMPKIESIAKSNERVEFLLRIKVIECNYKKTMEAKIGEIPILPKKLEVLHHQCLSEAKDLFHEANILKDKAEIQKYKLVMEGNIESFYQPILKHNEAKIKRIMTNIDDHVKNAGKVYYDSLEEFAADCWVEDIPKAKECATEKANVSFRARMSDLERQWFGNNERKALRSTFDLKQKRFEKKNNSRKGELDMYMSQLLMKAMLQYQDRMEVAVQLIEDMEQAHEKSKACALAFFNDSNIGKDTN